MPAVRRSGDPPLEIRKPADDHHRRRRAALSPGLIDAVARPGWQQWKVGWSARRCRSEMRWHVRPLRPMRARKDTTSVGLRAIRVCPVPGIDRPELITEFHYAGSGVGSQRPSREQRGAAQRDATTRDRHHRDAHHVSQHLQPAGASPTSRLYLCCNIGRHGQIRSPAIRPSLLHGPGRVHRRILLFGTPDAAGLPATDGTTGAPGAAYPRTTP